MVSFEDIPLKPLGKWKKRNGKYRVVGDDDSSIEEDNEEDVLYVSDGNCSTETDDYRDDEERRKRNHAYRRARWFVCYGWRWWCQRLVNKTVDLTL